MSYNEVTETIDREPAWVSAGIYWWELCDCHDRACPVIQDDAHPHSSSAERFHHRHYRRRAWVENVRPAVGELARFLRHLHTPSQRSAAPGLLIELHIAAHNAMLPEWLYLRHVLARWLARR